MPVKNKNRPDEDGRLTKYNLAVFIAIIFLSAFFRFYGLRTNPKWYSDEFVYLNAAWNLIHGLLQIGNIKWTFFTSVLPNPPLFSLINGLLLLVKYDIASMRLWVALCGVLTTVLIYFLGKELANKYAGLLSSFFFAVYPQAVMCNRRAWPHNQAMLFIALVFYGCIKYKNTKEKKWMYIAAASCGAASLTSYWVIGLFVFLFGFFLFADKRQLKTVVPAAVLPFIVFFIWAVINFRGDLAFDLKSTLAMAQAGAKYQNIFLFIVYNYFYFFRIDYFIALGTLGMFFTPKMAEKKALISIFILLSLEIFRQRSNIPIMFYPAVILTPMICIGLAMLVNFIFLSAEKIIKRKLPIYVLAVMLVPFLPAVITDCKGVSGGFNTKTADLLAVDNPGDAEAAAAYINANTVDSDIVLTSFDMMWLIKCRSTDLLFSSVQQGYTNQIFPLPMDQARFTFDSFYGNARYFVRDNIARRWTAFQDGVFNILYAMESDGWIKVFEKGEFCIYANPAFVKENEKENGKALTLIIENPIVYNNIAKSLYMNKMYDGAELELQKALAVSNDAVSHLHLGDVYKAKGMKDKAEKEYWTALQMNPAIKDASYETK